MYQRSKVHAREQHALTQHNDKGLTCTIVTASVQPESPKKRKAPTFRQPLVPVVRNETNKNVESTSSQEHVDFTASKVSGNEELLKKKVIELKRIEDKLERKLKYTEGSLRDARQTICNLRENDELKKAVNK